jgi:hypothetical protein
MSCVKDACNFKHFNKNIKPICQNSQPPPRLEYIRINSSQGATPHVYRIFITYSMADGNV